MDLNSIFSTSAIVVILLVIYYAGTWQRRKQEKELKKMQDNLKEGEKIVTFSGLSGVIEKVTNDYVIVQTNPDKLKITVEKWAVASIDDRTFE